MAKRDIKKTTEQIALVAGVLQPLMTLPQVWTIFHTHDAHSVSLATWVGYAILGLAFLAYGIANNLKPIWLTQSIWFFLQMCVVIGVLLYG